MRLGRISHAISNGEVSTIELEGLGKSRKSVRRNRVYNHDELHGLDIKTIPWDGR
jgi:hypothetical protein